MLFTDFTDPWYWALLDSLLSGALFFSLFAASIVILADIIHRASGYNGMRPSAYWLQEAKRWWKNPTI